MSEEQPSKTKYISSFWLSFIQIISPLIAVILFMWANDKVQDTKMQFIQQSLTRIENDFKDFKTKVESEFKEATRDRNTKDERKEK